MKKSIKTILHLLCLVCLLTLILSSCGSGDWGYDLLPNGYCLSRANSVSINLAADSYYYCFDDNTASQFALRGYIRRFCFNERYIGVQFYDYKFMHDHNEALLEHNQIHAEIVLDDKEVHGPQFDAYVPDFYIVDTEMHKRYGPFDEQTYNEKLEEFGITDMGEWLVTSPAPEGARFH